MALEVVPFTQHLEVAGRLHIDSKLFGRHRQPEQNVELAQVDAILARVLYASVVKRHAALTVGRLERSQRADVQTALLELPLSRLKILIVRITGAGVVGLVVTQEMDLLGLIMGRGDAQT